MHTYYLLGVEHSILKGYAAIQEKSQFKLTTGYITFTIVWRPFYTHLDFYNFVRIIFFRMNKVSNLILVRTHQA